MSRYNSAYGYLQLGLALDKKLEDTVDYPSLTARGKTLLIRASFWTQIGLNNLSAVDYFDAMNVFLLAMSCRSSLSVKKNAKGSDSKMTKLQAHLLLAIIGLTHSFYALGKLRWGFESLNLLMSLYQGFPDIEPDMMIYIRNMATFYDNRHNKLVLEMVEWEHILLGEKGNSSLNSRSLYLDIAQIEQKVTRKNLFGPRIESLINQWRLEPKEINDRIHKWFFDKMLTSPLNTARQNTLDLSTDKLGMQLLSLATVHSKLEKSLLQRSISTYAASEGLTQSPTKGRSLMTTDQNRSTSRGSVSEQPKIMMNSPPDLGSARKNSSSTKKEPVSPNQRQKRTVWIPREDEIYVSVEDIIQPIAKNSQSSVSKDLCIEAKKVIRVSGKKPATSRELQRDMKTKLKRFLDLKRPSRHSIASDLDKTATELVLRSLSTDFAETLVRKPSIPQEALLQTDVRDRRRILLTRRVEGTKKVAVLCRSADQTNIYSGLPMELEAPDQLEGLLKFESIKSRVVLHQHKEKAEQRTRHSQLVSRRRLSPAHPLGPTQGSRLEHIMRNHPHIFKMPKFFSVKEHLLLDKAALQEEADKQMRLRALQEQKSPFEQRLKADNVIS